MNSPSGFVTKTQHKNHIMKDVNKQQHRTALINMLLFQLSYSLRYSQNLQLNCHLLLLFDILKRHKSEKILK